MDKSMIHPPDDGNWIIWALGLFASVFTGAGKLVLNRFNRVENRIDAVANKKLSKDVFEEYRKANDQAHEYTHEALKAITRKLKIDD